MESCVYKVPTSEEYRLLQLCQYLSGESLKIIKSLGHSATAYQTAKERLQRKYSSKRWQIALCFEELVRLQLRRSRPIKSMEKFTNLLNIAVANLREVGCFEELSKWKLYTKLQKKIPG